MEQTRQFDPELTGDEDGGWDDALRYLNACGPGFHLQIARTVSTDQTLGASMVSQGSGISTALLADESQRGVRLVTSFAPGQPFLRKPLLSSCLSCALRDMAD